MSVRERNEEPKDEESKPSVLARKKPRLSGGTRWVVPKAHRRFLFVLVSTEAMG